MRNLLKTTMQTLSLAALLVILSFAVLHASPGTIVDAEGFATTFSKPFNRIISLYPAHTENLAYLGCKSQLAGIGRSDNYPDTILDTPRYSYRDNAEKFLAARPDLILIRPMISRSQPELIEKLRSAGITIISLQPTSVAEMFDYWRNLGRLTGHEAKAEEMIASFNTSISELQESLPADPELRPRVYFESIHAKMKTFAPSAISIFALEAAGGRNVAVDAEARNNSNIAPYGKERILARAGSIDVFLSQIGRMNRVTSAEIYTEPGFQLIKAVENKQVFLIEEELVSRPTMRLLTGIHKIRSLLYPELHQSWDKVASHNPPPNPQPNWQ